MNEARKADDSTGQNGESGGNWPRFVKTIRLRYLLRDAAVVTLWVVLLSLGWGLLRWPTWAYYVVVFGGIVAYSLLPES